MNESTVQNDRVAGVLLGMAAGDSLGAAYEFGLPLPDDAQVGMGGGRGWESGEWTDDTSMAIPIAREAGAGHDLRDGAALDRIAAAGVNWASSAKDVGTQIRTLIRHAAAPTAAGLAIVANPSLTIEPRMGNATNWLTLRNQSYRFGCCYRHRQK